MNESNRCAIYARFSSEKQNALSIDQQICKCREYAGRTGMAVLDEHIYRDEAVSGAIGDRAGLKLLLASARSKPKKIDVILCDDTSRFSRDLAFSLQTLKELKFHGIRVVFVGQGFDTTTPQNAMLVAMHGLMDEQYLEDLSLRTYRGVQHLAKLGLHTGGRVFGYRRVPIESATVLDSHGRPSIQGVRLEVEPSQAATIRKIFKLYTTGRSIKSIAIELNATGIESPQPQKGRVARSWCPSSVHHILHNERFAGVVCWGKTKKVRAPNGKKVNRKVPEADWHRNRIPEQRIISGALEGDTAKTGNREDDRIRQTRWTHC